MFNKYKKLSKFIFTETEICELLKSKEYFSNKKISFGKLVNHIERLKEYNVSFSSLTERLEKIMKLGKDSSSKKSFLYRYGWAGFRLYKEKNLSSTNTRNDLIRKFGKDYADSMLSLRGASEENYIKRHGSEDGTLRWKNYLKTRATTYKKKRNDGYIFPKYNLSYFINLYGSDEGTQIYNNKISKQAYKVSLEYYIDTYGEVQGRELCKKCKSHTSLSTFILKYGTLDGTKKYLEFISLLSVSLEEKYKKKYGDSWEEKYNNRFKGTLNCYKKKYGNDVGDLLFNKKIEKLSAGNNSLRSRSKISEELFNYVSVFVDDLQYYGKNEYTILFDSAEKTKYNRYFIRPDLAYNNKIIEFYGDAYHANPTIYGENDMPHPYRKTVFAKEIWKEDLERCKILEDKGYSVMIIWENEYKNSKIDTVNKCVEFLKDE